MATNPAADGAAQAARRARLGTSWAACADKPAFHLSPPSGWVNDPNGLILDPGTSRFHAFYQHVASGPAWAWGGLSWGHASSADGVVWAHEPIALTPSPGGLDAAGCWSGCCVPHGGGAGGGESSFTLLFTAVSLRGEGPHAWRPPPPLPACGACATTTTTTATPPPPPVPPAADLGLEQHEVQLAAGLVGGGGGGSRLAAWAKRAVPIIPHAPVQPLPGGGGRLAGFRDPFVFQAWRAGRPWRLALGSGRAGGRGCLLSYASSDPNPGAAAWAFQGSLASGKGVVAGRCGEVEARAGTSNLDAIDVGEVWECPFLVDLSSIDGRTFTLVCVSPYPHRTGAAGPDAPAGASRPTNPPLYWLCEGSCTGDAAKSIDLAHALVGPRRLDLGDALYAPTVPAAGGPGPGGEGVVMMAWFQELRPPHAHAHAPDASATPAGRARDYAGCLSLARRLSVRLGGADGKTPVLHQAPLAALAGLRVEAPPSAAPAWPVGTALEQGGVPVPIPGATGDAVDLELVFARPPGVCDSGAQPCATGVWLRPALAATGDAPGATTPTAVALLARWDTGDTGRLEVVHVTALTPAGCPDLRTTVRAVGGACAEVAGGRVALRVVADHSALEVFAGSGEALATRVYGCGGDRGASRSTPPRWSVFALGGTQPAPVPAAAGWAMGAGWEEE